MSGKNVAIITSDTGIERDELIEPIKALRDKGVKVIHASIGGKTVQTMVGEVEKDRTVEAAAKISALNADDYDAIVIPGGTVNADTLRQDQDAQRLLKGAVNAKKVIAAICHGPWTLIDAGVVQGKTLTSYPSCAVDLKNAGAAGWVDQEMKQCGANGWTLITSRNPNDIPAFNDAIIKAIGA